MRLSPATIFLALASLFATTEGCLTLFGRLTYNDFMIIEMVDNGIQVCTFWGTHTGGAQGMACKAGYAAWIQLQKGGANTGDGICAYSTGYGANNYRFAVRGDIHYVDASPNPAEDYEYRLTAREYC